MSSEEVSKTGHSKREIQMPPFVMQELMEWKKFCPENELNLVFPSETGTFMDFSVKSEELENYVFDVIEKSLSDREIKVLYAEMVKNYEDGNSNAKVKEAIETICDETL